MQQKLRLKETKTEIFNETLANFTQREEGLYCIHSKGFKEIGKSINCSNYEQEKDLSDSEDNEADEVIVHQLRVAPLLVAVFLDREYAIISKATRQLKGKFTQKESWSEMKELMKTRRTPLTVCKYLI